MSTYFYFNDERFYPKVGDIICYNYVYWYIFTKIVYGDAIIQDMFSDFKFKYHKYANYSGQIKVFDGENWKKY